MSLYNVIGESKPDYLQADPQGADIIAIPCEPGNGEIQRGTVMYRKSTGMYAPAQNGDVTSGNMLVVLDEKVDTDASMTIAEDARAYRAGRLIYGKVKLGDGSALSAANMTVLRGQNIVFNHAIELAPEVDNGRIAILYKPNGGTGSDVAAYAAKGASYTIAANTFTAPASKAFSKWNTKADGSGTDYTAASTYTANADLTLYAIWA